MSALAQTTSADIVTRMTGVSHRYQDDGRLLLPATLPHRLMQAVGRRVFKLPEDHFQKTALKRFLRENKVDAALAEYGPTGAAVMEVFKKAGVPLIVHFHGNDAYAYKTIGPEGQVYRELFENAAAIIGVSRDMEAQLLDLGAPRHLLHYNPYGVDVSLFCGARPDPSPPLFVAVGRFVDKKAPYLTLVAFKSVVKACPEARLVMIGDGQLWEFLGIGILPWALRTITRLYVIGQQGELYENSEFCLAETSIQSRGGKTSS